MLPSSRGLVDEPEADPPAAAGNPWENGYVESFNARLRDEFLDGEIFYTLEEVQVLTERWRWQYNHVWPHQSLGYRPPAPEARGWPLAASREDKQAAIH